MTRIGSLCSGYEGIGLGLASALGVNLSDSLAWHAEYDKAPAAILKHHFPHVPNYRDVKEICWPALEPVDWLTAGYPCQPFSTAGKRKGEDDPRHLWPHIAEGIRIVRPHRVLLENVPGHLSLGFGAVLGDLAEIGYDARWIRLPASGVGAPHKRERLYVIATDTTNERHERARSARVARHGPANDSLVNADAGSERLEGSELQRVGLGVESRNGDGCSTPADTNGSGLEVGRSIGINARTQRAAIERGSTAWGKYAAAIERWERVTGRVAPWAVEPSPKAGGRDRLSPRFTEWMMGLPDGWITDPAIGLTRTEQIKAAGNGVVPQQCAEAVRYMLAEEADEMQVAA